MINEFKQTSSEYEKNRIEFLKWLRSEIDQKCGLTKLSQHLGFSDAYLNNAFKRDSSANEFWFNVHKEMQKFIELKRRLMND